MAFIVDTKSIRSLRGHFCFQVIRSDGGDGTFSRYSQSMRIVFTMHDYRDFARKRIQLPTANAAAGIWLACQCECVCETLVIYGVIVAVVGCVCSVLAELRCRKGDWVGRPAATISYVPVWKARKIVILWKCDPKAE